MDALIHGVELTPDSQYLHSDDGRIRVDSDGFLHLTNRGKHVAVNLDHVRRIVYREGE